MLRPLPATSSSYILVLNLLCLLTYLGGSWSIPLLYLRRSERNSCFLMWKWHIRGLCSKGLMLHCYFIVASLLENDGRRMKTHAFSFARRLKLSYCCKSFEAQWLKTIATRILQLVLVERDYAAVKYSLRAATCHLCWDSVEKWSYA